MEKIVQTQKNTNEKITNLQNLQDNIKLREEVKEQKNKEIENNQNQIY